MAPVFMKELPWVVAIQNNNYERVREGLRINKFFCVACILPKCFVRVELNRAIHNFDCYSDFQIPTVFLEMMKHLNMKKNYCLFMDFFYAKKRYE